MAGKRIKGATITFEVTDDGTLKQVGQKAKSAKKGLDGVSKSAGDARRNMQAMSGRVESGTKGFARMQQGTGGLVQTYAILASTLFAVGAAFRALENAANIQNQIKGFKELAAITGTSMLTTTAAVRQATGGLLEFQAAAQQVAIATAAGFSRDQIVGLAEGAKLASVALGRDMTDSFNRLIRGVTKAEPELLDELGIILRLDIATRKFAATQGLVAEKLTIAQRRMAVYNEVQKQLDENFGAFGEDADKYLNAFTRFATTISDVAKDVGGFVTRVLEPVVAFLDRSSGVLGVVLSVIAFNMLKQVVPAANDMSGALTRFSQRAKDKLIEYDKQIEKTSARIKKAGKKTITVEGSVSAAFKKDLKKRGVADKFFNMRRFQDQKAHITKYLKQLPRKTKAEKATAKKIEVMYRAAYKKIELAQKQGLTKAGLSFKKMGLQIEKFVSIPAQKAAQAVAFIGKAALAAAPAVRVLGAAASTLMGFLMAFMTLDFVFELFSSGYRQTKEAIAELNDQNKKLLDQTDETLNVLTGSFKQHERAMEDGKIAAYEAAAAFKFMGNALAGIGDPDAMQKTFDEINKQVQKARDGLFNFGRAEGKGRSNAAQYIQNQVLQGLTDPNARADIQKALADMLSDKDRTYGTITQTGTSVVMTQASERSEFNRVFKESLELMDKEDTRMEGQGKLVSLFERFNEQLFTHSGLLQTTTGGTIMMSDAGLKFIDTIRDATAETKKAGEGIIGLEEAAKNLRQTIDQLLPKPTMFSNFVSGFAQIAREIKQSNKDYNNFAITMADGTVYKLREGLIKLLEKELGLTKEAATAIADRKETLSEVFTLTDNLIKGEKTYLSLLDTQKKRLMFFDTSINRRRAMQLDLQKVEAQRIRALGEFTSKQEIYNKLNSDVTTEMKATLDAQLAQVEALEAQGDILEGNLNIAKAFASEILKAADAAGTQALKDALIGDKSSNEIREKLAKDLQSAGAGFIAGKGMELIGAGFEKIMPQGVKDLFGVGKMSKEATELQAVHMEHITGMADILDQHVKGVAKATGTNANVGVTPGGGSNPIEEFFRKKFGDNVAITKPGESDPFTDSMFDLDPEKKEQGFFGRIFSKIGGIFGTAPYQREGDHGDQSGIENITTVAGGNKPGLLGTHGGTDLFGIKNAMSDIFGEGGVFHQTGLNLFGGKESVFGKLGNSLFGEGGALGKIFGGGEGGIMGGIGQMFGAGGKGIGGMLGGLFGGGGGGGGIMALLKPLLSMIPGIGPLLSILPFAKGGIIGNKMVALERGGVMPRYAKGGIATQPTYLVGEGKKNEAVVPLPDNKSIPVDLGRGAGNENNVSISVNMADGSTSTKSDAESGKQLGAAINAAVLQELERQQRPGGMLQAQG